MRHPPLLMICALSILTGIVAGLITNQGMPVTGRQPTAAAMDVSVIDRFYEEVNTTLSGGNGSGFEMLLTSDFVHHTSNTIDVLGPGEFRDSLFELRTVYPELHLSATGINVVQDTVLVQVQATGGESTELIGFSVGRHDAWSSFDQFRIERGRIAERWSPSKGVSIELARQEDLTIPAPAMRRFRLNRITLTNNQLYKASFDDPALLINENGLLSVTTTSWCRGLTKSEQAPPNPTIDGRVKAPPESTAVLGPGETIKVLAGTCITISIQDRESAELLFVSAVLPSIPGGAPAANDAETFTGPLEETLAGGLAGTVPIGACIISFGRLTLAPGVGLPEQTTTGPQLIFVESGTLDVKIQDGHAWSQERPSGMARMISEGSLEAGSGLLVPTGAKVVYEAEGEAPTEFLVIVLVPIE